LLVPACAPNDGLEHNEAVLARNGRVVLVNAIFAADDLVVSKVG
jgi:hypothetical protein